MGYIIRFVGKKKGKRITRTLSFGTKGGGTFAVGTKREAEAVRRNIRARVRARKKKKGVTGQIRIVKV